MCHILIKTCNHFSQNSILTFMRNNEQKIYISVRCSFGMYKVLYWYFHSLATCREAYFQGSTKTGIKKLKHDGYKFKAFCIYNEDGTGWFYPSKQAVTDNNTFTLNLDDQYDSRDVARVRIFFEDGSQKDSTMEQLSTHTSR